MIGIHRKKNVAKNDPQYVENENLLYVSVRLSAFGWNIQFLQRTGSRWDGEKDREKYS